MSVIIPNLNHGRFLNKTIESILDQTYRNFELLIIDNGSTDNSLEIINKFARLNDKVCCINNVHSCGVSSSRNIGLKLSKGEFIAFCDADDVWLPLKLERQLSEYYYMPYPVVIHTDAYLIDEEGIELGYKFSQAHLHNSKHSGNIFHDLCIRNFINTSSILINRNSLSNKDLFKTDYKYFEDWLFWLSISKNTQFHYIDEPLLEVRVHSKSTNKDFKGYAEHRIRACRDILSLYPKIPNKIKSSLYYDIAYQSSFLSQRDASLDSLELSLRNNFLNIKAAFRYLQYTFFR